MRQWHLSWDGLRLHLQLCFIYRQEVMYIMPIWELCLDRIIRILRLIQQVARWHLKQPQQNTIQLSNDDNMWLWFLDPKQFRDRLLINGLKYFPDLFLLNCYSCDLTGGWLLLHWWYVWLRGLFEWRRLAAWALGDYTKLCALCRHLCRWVLRVIWWVVVAGSTCCWTRLWTTYRWLLLMLLFVCRVAAWRCSFWRNFSRTDFGPFRRVVNIVRRRVHDVRRRRGRLLVICLTVLVAARCFCDWACGGFCLM